jgi:hypothetical protein
MGYRVAISRAYGTIPFVAGAVDRTAWQAGNLSLGAAYPWLSRHREARTRTRVLVVFDEMAFGMPVDAITESVYSVPFLERAARESADVDAMGKRLRQRGVTHILFNEEKVERHVAEAGQFTAMSRRARGLLDEFRRRLGPPVFNSGPIMVYSLQIGR